MSGAASGIGMPLIVAAISLLLAGLLIRLVVILPAAHRPENPPIQSAMPVLEGNLMILLGSGGHTGEMIRLAERMDISSCSRTWLVSSNDNSSLQKLEAFENSLRARSRGKEAKVNIATLPRARKVKQPLLLSVKSTIVSLISCVRQLRRLPAPDVLILNGPGTSVPVAYVMFAMKYLGLCRTRIVYVESLARVNRLSLSGRLLLPIANRFVVQWEQLSVQYRRAEFYGILV